MVKVKSSALSTSYNIGMANRFKKYKYNIWKMQQKFLNKISLSIFDSLSNEFIQTISKKNMHIKFECQTKMLPLE